MKEIWNLQAGGPANATDLDQLHKRVSRRSSYLNWSVTAEEFGMTAICLAVATYQAWEPLFRGTDRYQFVGTVLLLGVAGYMMLGRYRRLRRERVFESTVLGELDRAIDRIDYHIWRSRTFQWWFLLPSSVIVLISFSQNYATKSPWSWVVVVLSFLLAFCVVQLGMLRGHLPIKLELEAVRERLREET